jgi:hypothetical protein
MGRSVYVPYDAAVTAYVAVDCEDWLEILDAELCAALPSLKSNICRGYYPAYRGERYDYYSREAVVVASNKLCDVVVAEYCGLASVSLVPTAGNLGWAWANKVRAKLMKCCEPAGNLLIKKGTFSNGEAIFDSVNSPNPGELGLGYSSKEGWL